MFFTLASPKANFSTPSPFLNDPFFTLPEPVFPEIRFPAIMPLATDLSVLDMGKNLQVIMPNPHISTNKIKMSVRKGDILLIEGSEQKKHAKINKHSKESQESHNSVFHQVLLPPGKVDLKNAQFHVDPHSDLLVITLPKIHPKKEKEKE